MTGHAAHMRKARNEDGVLFGNLEVIEYGRCGVGSSVTGGNFLTRRFPCITQSVFWCVCVPVYCNIELIFGVILLYDAVW